MKQITLIIIFQFLVLSVFSQKGETIIQRAAENLAKETVKIMQKNKVPEDVKIAVMNFPQKTKYSDTLITRLGIDFTNAYIQKLQEEIQKKKLGYTLLTSNKDAEEQMKIYFSNQKTQDPKEFFKQFIENKTPDFYIVGNYSIDDDFKFFKTLNVKIKPNNFDFKSELKEMAVTDLSEEVTKEDGNFLNTYKTVSNLQELAENVAFQYRFQNNIRNIILSNITYETTGLSSKFSLMLSLEKIPQD